MNLSEHHQFMDLALHEAEEAYDNGEIPVGAVLVKDGQVIARAHNRVEAQHSVVRHAEIEIIERHAVVTGQKYLSGCTLYVTLEPCPMCASALVWAKIDNVVFGAMDIKQGACGSIYHFNNNSHLNHRYKVLGGIRELECEALLKTFFKEQRKNKSS